MPKGLELHQRISNLMYFQCFLEQTCTVSCIRKKTVVETIILCSSTLYFKYNPSQTHKTVESEKGYYPIVKVMHCSHKMDTYKHIEQGHDHKLTVDINRKEVSYSYA